MDDYESLSHTTWTCKYHVVFIPKCRRKALYLELRRHLGELFRKLALQKESKVEEGHLILPSQKFRAGPESKGRGPPALRISYEARFDHQREGGLRWPGDRQTAASRDLRRMSEHS